MQPEYTPRTGKPPVVRKPSVFEPTRKQEGDLVLQTGIAKPWWRK